eukprot:TRINITY_DN1637_c0_g1_i1.p1 TRINITY_DN1637_c0_g1~~TRINITY_DN1637_c0_g1_i1.p1  ORF type:complete len:462 (+),score=99.13 TRINITY_DN1637_c0_g1_i1:590-1975(+)
MIPGLGTRRPVPVPVSYIKLDIYLGKSSGASFQRISDTPVLQLKMILCVVSHSLHFPWNYVKRHPHTVVDDSTATILSLLRAAEPSSDNIVKDKKDIVVPQMATSAVPPYSFRMRPTTIMAKAIDAKRPEFGLPTHRETFYGERLSSPSSYEDESDEAYEAPIHFSPLDDSHREKSEDASEEDTLGKDKRGLAALTEACMMERDELHKKLRVEEPSAFYPRKSIPSSPPSASSLMHQKVNKKKRSANIADIDMSSSRILKPLPNMAGFPSPYSPSYASSSSPVHTYSPPPYVTTFSPPSYSSPASPSSSPLAYERHEEEYLHEEVKQELPYWAPASFQLPARVPSPVEFQRNLMNWFANFSRDFALTTSARLESIRLMGAYSERAIVSATSAVDIYAAALASINLAAGDLRMGHFTKRNLCSMLNVDLRYLERVMEHIRALTATNAVSYRPPRVDSKLIAC